MTLRATLLRAVITPLCVVASAAAQGGAVLPPTPESVLGHTVGADYKLANYTESIAYFRRLAAATDRMRLIDVGKTSTGRDWTLAVISSPANLANLDRLRAIAQRIAHPAGLTDAEARALAREGRPFVDISGGLHASEAAGAQHTIQLAYDLVSRNDERTRAILDNTVLLLWPSINPDGQEIVANWYRENVGTPYEVSPLHELYQKYIGHDNNRDGYMLNVVESRVVTKVWREWEPQIIYVQHQTSPFPTRIWLPPFAEPIGLRVNPLMSRQVNTIGMAIAQQLETEGKPGATHMGTGFDAWYPGYIDYLPMFQNVNAFWTETALYRYATPHFYTLSDFPADMRDFRPQALYASPWKGGWWRIKDAVDYMHTASMAVLDYAVRYREELLWNRYQAGRNTIAKYRAEPPYAYVIPQEQRDVGNAVEMLRRLALNGIRVHQLQSDATIDGVRRARGSWVIPMDQEFAELARQLLEVQKYPDLREYPGGPPEQPYDAAGWTLPFQMDVRTIEARSPLSAESRSALGPSIAAEAIVPPPARIIGSGDQFVLDPAVTNAFRLVTRALTDGASVQFDNGRYVVPASAAMERLAQEWGVNVTRRARPGSGGGVPVRSRIGLYSPWTASMDAGWTEWLFDTFGVPYTIVRNSDIRAGDLHARFDVLVIASERTAAVMDGYAQGNVPPRYEGGVGVEGVRAIDAFVRAGGTLVAFSGGTDFAIKQLHLPVKNDLEGVARREFFSGGSIMEVTTDAAHPVMAGMPERARIFVDNSPAFSTLAGFEGAVLARYPAAGSPLASGYLLGEKYLHGKAAALDVRHGRGHVVLLGFRPQWRGQPFGTFKVVFNSVLFAGEVARGAKGGPVAVEAAKAP